MGRLKIGKPVKELIAIIEAEGATIMGTRHGPNHIHVDYTFDHHLVHTQHLPRSGSHTGDARWSRNFRAAVRKTKPST
jgi:hypothetical protein